MVPLPLRRVSERRNSDIPQVIVGCGEMADFKIVKVPSIIPDLLKICPGIDSRWQEHLEYWGDDERGEYNDASVIVHFVVDSYSKNRTHFFPRLFAKVEEYITTGHPKQKEIAVLGFLETLQTVGSNQEFGYKPFEQWLGQSSLLEWRRLEAVWEGKSSLMDVVRDEQKED